MSSFPKFLHKGWKAHDNAPGLFVPAESQVAHDEAEAKELTAKGFTEAPPEHKPKAEKKAEK